MCLCVCICVDLCVCICVHVFVSVSVCVKTLYWTFEIRKLRKFHLLPLSEEKVADPRCLSPPAHGVSQRNPGIWFNIWFLLFSVLIFKMTAITVILHKSWKRKPRSHTSSLLKEYKNIWGRVGVLLYREDVRKTQIRCLYLVQSILDKIGSILPSILLLRYFFKITKCI